jgi:hypothetical protein
MPIGRILCGAGRVKCAFDLLSGKTVIGADGPFQGITRPKFAQPGEDGP